eukprot:1680749-Amphidinium_carterae.1
MGKFGQSKQNPTTGFWQCACIQDCPWFGFPGQRKQINPKMFNYVAEIAANGCCRLVVWLPLQTLHLTYFTCSGRVGSTVMSCMTEDDMESPWPDGSVSRSSLEKLLLGH